MNESSYAHQLKDLTIDTEKREHFVLELEMSHYQEPRFLGASMLML